MTHGSGGAGASVINHSGSISQPIYTFNSATTVEQVTIKLHSGIV
jgi:hypothetical protein